MVRIAIEDLPVLEELTQEEMASVVGGDGGAIPGLDGGSGLPTTPTTGLPTDANH
jgi:bacteriocin-like protein